MKQRSTAQLAAIYDAVASSTDHPTADQVLERVRREAPRVSLGTVYRNLEKLRLQGRVRMVRLAGSSAHYDAVMEEHDHFTCERCGAVSDLEATVGRRPTMSLEGLGYVVRWQTTAVYGLCRECSGAADSDSAGAAE
jgi:Fe2+ or Zn2+ uptake regulation protein